MIRSCNIAIYYRLLIYSNLVTGSNVLDKSRLCIFNGGWNNLFFYFSNTTKYHHIFRQLKVQNGSGWVRSIVSC